MPRYSYDCEPCKKEWESFHFIRNRHSEKCSVCGHRAQLIISGGSKVHLFKPYDYFRFDDGNVHFETRAQETAYLASKGLRRHEKGETLKHMNGSPRRHKTQTKEQLEKEGTYIGSSISELRKKLKCKV